MNIRYKEQFADLFNSLPANKVIGITSGVFDLLHPLHINYLERCKSACDVLVVGLDSDELVHSFKNKIPIHNLVSRVYVMEALRCVDHTFVMNSAQDLLVAIKGIKGTDENPKDLKLKMFKHSSTLYGEEIIGRHECEVVIIPDVNIYSSTTEIINAIKDR